MHVLSDIFKWQVLEVVKKIKHLVFPLGSLKNIYGYASSQISDVPQPRKRKPKNKKAGDILLTCAMPRQKINRKNEQVRMT